MQRAAASENFESLTFTAQQNQGSGITRPHYRFTRDSRHLHNVVHGKSAKNSKFLSHKIADYRFDRAALRA
jgi:hypothetical protein